MAHARTTRSPRARRAPARRAPARTYVRARRPSTPRARMVSCGTPTPQRNRFVGAVLHLDDGDHWRVVGCNTRKVNGQPTYTLENTAGRRRVIAKATVARLAHASPEDVEGGIPWSPPAPRQILRGVPISAKRIPMRAVAQAWIPFLKRAKTLGRRVILDGEGRICNLQGVPYQPHVEQCDPVTGRTRARNGKFKKGCGPRAARAPARGRSGGEPGNPREWEADDWERPAPRAPARSVNHDDTDDGDREPWEILRDERLTRTELVVPEYWAAYQSAVRAGTDVTIGDDGIPRSSMTGDPIPR